MIVAAGATFFAELNADGTGFVGALTVSIVRLDDAATILAPTTAGIVESPAGSSHYIATLTAPLAPDSYAIVWDIDGISGSEALTVVALVEGLPPTPDQIRARSALLTAQFPAPADPSDPDPLMGPLGDAIALVEAVTCRLIDTAVGCSNCELVPENLINVALRAVALKTEYVAVGNDPKLAKALASGRRLRGFTAGPYSESYFGPGDLGVKNGRPRVDANDALDEALWALMTESCREAFIAVNGGHQPPAGAATAFDYRLQPGGFFATERFGPGGTR